MGGDDSRSFFVVVPDDDVSCARLDPERVEGFDRVDHPSGRPWLVGRFATDDLRCAEAGPYAVAVIGECAVADTALRDAVSRYGNRPDLARLRRDIGAGDFHVVVRGPDGITVCGTATGSRLAYHTRSAGRTLVASRSDVLAALHGYEVDDEALALRLLMNSPYPLNRRVVWRGVTMVPPGSAVTVRRDDPSGAVEHAWWEPAAAVRGLDEGATELLRELRAAVAVRTGSGRELSADLSGGFDSTSVCFLAAEADRPFTTYTVHDGDETDDHVVSRAASADLTRSTSVWHHVAELTDEYAHLADGHPWSEEPAEVFLSRRRLHDTLTALAHAGPAVHLTGDGGDNLTRPGHSYCHELVRRAPLQALRHVRALRHTARWSLRDVAARLWDNQPYGAWLGSCAEFLRDHDREVGLPDFTWGPQPTLPPWASPAAVDLAGRALRGAADTCQPLAASRSRHIERHAMFLSTSIVRHMNQVTEAADVRVAAPFTDDRVFEAALAVRPAERFDPWTFKPLLRQAMRGVVPDYVLSRTTKTVVPGDVRLQTVRRHQEALLDLLHGSALAAAGVIDESALRAQFRQQTVRGVLALHLPGTVSVEVWLRRLGEAHRPITPFTDRTEHP